MDKVENVKETLPKIQASSTTSSRNYPWNPESPTFFVCRRCKKTFYNAVALQNHNNTQHDGETMLSDGDSVPFYEDKAFIGGFHFIPSDVPIDDSKQTVCERLTTRTFTEDTTYIIVKLDGCDEDGEKKVQPKAPVDLRGPFTCTFPSTLRPDLQCRQTFQNCCDYSIHYREEHTKRRKAALRCQVCEKRLDSDPPPPPSDARQTLTPIMFSCRMCGQSFRDSTTYDEHNRVVHAKTKPHQCPLCSKRFTQQGGLHQHMRMHSGIRPFACTVCPKAFTQKAGLDQHLRTHTKVKPFRCVICSKAFSQSVHLRQHMRTHTNIQPFVCSVCGRRFKQSSHLNFHVRSHLADGSLPVECYARLVQHNNLQFLSLANLQQVQDGETFYYAAEIAPVAHNHNFQPSTYHYPGE